MSKEKNVETIYLEDEGADEDEGEDKGKGITFRHFSFRHFCFRQFYLSIFLSSTFFFRPKFRESLLLYVIIGMKVFLACQSFSLLFQNKFFYRKKRDKMTILLKCNCLIDHKTALSGIHY
jgi:hypothetical protein